ncbi:MAG: hypothetical protein JSV91_12825 [Phycisphaerales bacterium]|nr:MAG: hypothetical protein JSV91_12825 [Phycisphaerales bacterium]
MSSKPTDEEGQKQSAERTEVAENAYLALRLTTLGVETPTERKVKRVVPWVASAAIHIGLIVLGLLVTWTVVVLQQEEEPVLIIADFDAMTYDPVAALDANLDTETERAVQDRLPTEPEPPSDVPDDLSDWEMDPVSLIVDAGGESSLAEFAPRPLEGSATFIGLTSTNARRIVYVIDASGSMMASLQVVIQELRRSLDGLAPPQQFGIIFFQRNEAVVVPPPNRLIRAMEQEKRRVMDWIDAGRNVVPGGRSNPLKALERALALDPDVVFLLSTNITGSGEYEIDQEDLLRRLDELNPIDSKTNRRQTQINCIQFLDPDPLDTLRKIAAIHGGERGYKFLDRRELGLRRP